MVGAFERWREHWEQRRSLRRIASRLSNMAVSRCFDRWLAALDAWSSEREEEEHEAALSALRAEIEAQQERVVRRIVSRWRQQGLSKSKKMRMTVTVTIPERVNHRVVSFF